ncbi:MAG: cupin domain-containing protein, partial [Bacteroidota bacterium]
MTTEHLIDIFPKEILNLPEADIPFKGVRGWVSQGETSQVVFFDIQAIGEVAEHSHCAQWGIVIEGEMHLF